MPVQKGFCPNMTIQNERGIYMIKIGICDEDTIFSDKLYNIINLVMVSVDEWETQVYHSSQELIRSIEESTFDCQLLFIDIMNENGNGLKTARYIYDHQVDTDLILITASKEHVFECYRYHAFAYLLKPISEQDIVEELRRYLSELQLSPKYVPVSFQGTTHQIPVSSILYFESVYRKVIVHTKKDRYECYQKLSFFEELLKKEEFLRCHQSYLVSARHVTDYTKNWFFIKNIRIPISRNYQTNIHKYIHDSGIFEKDTSAPPTIYDARKGYGALICVKGTYLGSIIQICPEQKIQIGRDEKKADLIINLPYVSRRHCSLLYHKDTKQYEVVDYSQNGTFVNGTTRLVKGETYLLKSGQELCFGDKETVYKLG